MYIYRFTCECTKSSPFAKCPTAPNTGDQRDQDLGKDDHTLFHQVLLPQPLAVSKQALGPTPTEPRGILCSVTWRKRGENQPFIGNSSMQVCNSMYAYLRLPTCKHRSNLVHCYNRSSQKLSPFATREYIVQGLRMKYWFV